MPYLATYRPDDELIPLLLKAQQHATEAGQRGARSVLPPTQLPPLDVSALMRMTPEQADLAIRQRRLLQERNKANDQDAQARLNVSIDREVKNKERENQATEYAAQLGDVLPQYKEAAAAKDKAAADLAEISKVAAEQRAKGIVWFTPDKATKPDPKTGVFVVPPGTFSAPAAPKVPGRLWGMLGPSSEATAEADQLQKMHQGAASKLNDEFTKRTDAANQAIQRWKVAEQELKQADSNLRKPGFLFRDNAVHDVFTKKSYPLAPQAKSFDVQPEDVSVGPAVNFNERKVMSLALLFWMLMIISLIFGLWANWPASGSPLKPVFPTLLIFILLAILGWAQFGAAIHR